MSILKALPTAFLYEPDGTESGSEFKGAQATIWCG